MPNFAADYEELQPFTLDGQQIDQNLRAAHGIDNLPPTLGFICRCRREQAVEGVNC